MRSQLLVLTLLGLLLCPSCNRQQPKPEEVTSLTILTYNVWYGFTIQPERKDAWLQWVASHAPDIVSLQELNEYTEEKLAADAASWGHEYSVLLKHEGFPTGFTSRFPIEEVTRTLDGFHHGLMRVKTAGLYVYVVHLHPSNWEVRIDEIKQVLKDVRNLPPDSKIVLAGDFNTFSPADSSHYSEQTDLETFFGKRDVEFDERNLRNGILDVSVIGRVLDAGFVDLEGRFRPGFTGTFPTRIEKEGEHGDLRRLDYLFADPTTAAGAIYAVSISDSTTAFLSDHYPVMAELAISNSLLSG